MLKSKKRIKFRNIFSNRKIIKNKRICKLTEWCKKFNKMGFTSEKNRSAGNLSFRTNNGFIISCSKSNFSNITPKEFTEVINVDIDKNVAYTRGLKEPSSESFMHSAIYNKRREINAIFHGHCDNFIKFGEKFNIKTTLTERPAGSLELMQEVIKVLDKHYFLLIKNHGFLSLGRSMDGAGNLAIKKYKLIY